MFVLLHTKRPDNKRNMEIIIIVIIAIIVVAVMGYYIMKLTTERDVQKNNAESYLRELNTQKTVYEQQIDALKTSYEQQLQLTAVDQGSP